MIDFIWILMYFIPFIVLGSGIAILLFADNLKKLGIALILTCVYLVVYIVIFDLDFGISLILLIMFWAPFVFLIAVVIFVMVSSSYRRLSIVVAVGVSALIIIAYITFLNTLY